MCIAGAAILCCLQPVLAATHYVATDGSDENPGNEALPFRTIQKAADTAQSGDTVLVRGGQYTEEITLNNSGVTFMSVGPDRAVVDGGGRRPHGFHVPGGGNITDIVIQGFEITGQTEKGIYVEGIPGRQGNRYVNLSDLQANTPFEESGKDFDPLLIDPEHGNLDYPKTSPAADGSLALESPYGSQLGARGLLQTEPDFVHLSLTAIAASVHEDRMRYTTDRLQQTYWLSGDGVNRDQWIV